ncbi:MAG: HAD family phosphatase [Bacillota bacterium]|nr:HAD family phosphatase [Bacillota bacterium]
MNDSKAVIFDMDGVLVDSEPLYIDKVNRFYKLCNKEVSYKELCKLVGSSYNLQKKLMTQWFGEDINEDELMDFYFKKSGKLRFNYDDIINPYIKYILPKLKQDNIKTAIASSSPKEDIEKFLNDCGLNDYFDYVVSGRGFKESKPNPEIYLYTVDKLQVEKGNCIILEDSSYGIQAAKNAGIYVMAHYEPRFGFDQSDADDIFYDFLEAYHKIKEKFENNMD